MFAIDVQKTLIKRGRFTLELWPSWVWVPREYILGLDRCLDAGPFTIKWRISDPA